MTHATPPDARYSKIVRGSAIYDLLVTAPFATPWTFHYVHKILSEFGPIPAFEPTHTLFANLLGSVVLVWSLVRIRDPQPVFGLFDAMARALFLFWQIYFLVVHHITPVVGFFAFFEFAWLIPQAYGFWLLSKVGSGNAPTCRIIDPDKGRMPA